MNARLLLAALLALPGCARAADPGPPPIEVESGEVEAHRLSEYYPLRDISAHDGFGQIQVRLVVGSDGTVASAQVETDARSGEPAPRAAVASQASEQARRWRYRPFSRDGRPVTVTFVEVIPLYPPEDRPSRHVEMPPFDRSFRVTLERGGCFGTCPVYSVAVAADGTVDFDGGDYVFVRGRHRTRIDPDAVRRLYELARRADFFSLRASYRAGVTDSATYVTTIEAGGRRWTLEDYVGETVGMPSIVRRLEDAIDEAAETRRWIEGDETVVPRLAAEGFEFRSFEGARMLGSAAAAGKASIVAQLVDVGAPLRASPPAGSFASPVVALTSAAQGGDATILALLLSRRADWSAAELHAALDAAAAGGHDEAFGLLGAHGALAGIDRPHASLMLRQAAQSGDPRLVARILALHPDVNWIGRTYPNEQALAGAARVSCPWNRGPPACDPPTVVAMLLRAGANPRIVNPRTPESPLIFVGDVRIAHMLLAAGADPNFADYDGEPPIFSVYDEDVALALLDAGANPRARRPADRMNVAGWARYQQWPHVLARLHAEGADRP